MLKRLNLYSKYIFYVFRFAKDGLATFSLLAIFTSILLGISEVLISYSLQLFLSSANILNLKSDFLDQISGRISFTGSIIILISLYILKSLLTLVSSQIILYVGEKININLKRIIFEDFLFQSQNTPRSSSEVYFNFIEIIPKSAAFYNILITLTSIFIQALIIFLMMLLKNPYETLTSIPGIILIALVTIFLSKSFKPIATKIPKQSLNLANRVEKSSRNLLFFNIMRIREHEINVFTKVLTNLSNLVLKLNTYTTLISSLPQILGLSLVLSIIYLSKTHWNTNSGELIAFLYLFLRLTTTLSASSNQLMTLLSYLPQLEKAYRFLKTTTEEVKGQNQSFDINFFGSKETIAPPNLVNTNQITRTAPPTIQISNLSYSYKASTIVFSNLNLSIPPGQITGILGESGKGKSTLLMLIAGILRPDSGSITISGYEARQFFENPKNRISYAGAEPFLIKGTIKENLLYGIKHSVTQEEISTALKHSQLEDFIEEYGLNHKINEDTSGISAGQKQRICITRAILNQPSLLILDEATSNLDTANEKIILENLKSLSNLMTIIYVSHKKDTLWFCDKIFNL